MSLIVVLDRSIFKRFLEEWKRKFLEIEISKKTKISILVIEESI